LWLFVAASVALPAIRRFHPGPLDGPLDAARAGAAAPLPGEAEAAATFPPNCVIVYCFRGKVRCQACNEVEAAAREAVRRGFPEPLKQGRLQWRVVDYQRPGNEHFAEEYQLVASSVVLVQLRDGVPQRWKNLLEVWQYAGDQEAAVRYVQTEIGRWLGDLGI
jgi:hypothetical protein